MYTEIVDDIYDITCREEPSGKRYRVFLDTREPATLFDAGFADTVDAVRDRIAEIGTNPERLVVTHGDPDHIDGMAALAETYDLDTWVPMQTRPETEPDHRYGEGDRVGRWVAVHTPGHEPDNHVLIDEDAGVAIMGDAISGADQRGLPVGHVHLPPAVYSQDLNRAEESLARVLDYEFDAALVYHGSSITDDAHAKLDRYVNFPGKPT